MKRLLILLLAGCAGCTSTFARGGLLGASLEEVSAILGEPAGHDQGNLAGSDYHRYHFETNGWKTLVLFIDGKAQKFETQKSDSSALAADETKMILDGYDLPDSPENSKIRGWRPLAENHLIRGDGRVHAIKRPASVTIFLDDLPREFW